MPKISIIIPCYNQGQFLDEAVQSVLEQTFQDFEIIIVNDGSTDAQTKDILKNLNKPNTRVINTSNQKLASARNNGIKEATGKYILPLDADDKIGPEYLELANEILDNNSDIGIVYCLCEFFGAEKGLWELPEYNFPKMLLVNRIFCSSLFRRSDWEKVGGYNPNMVYSYEDWDFWLSLIEIGVGVHQIQKVMFYYRQHSNGSMLNKLGHAHRLKMKKQIIENHKDLYMKNIEFIQNNTHVLFA